MGATLAARAGFEKRELVRVKRCRMHDQSDELSVGDVGDVELWVAVRPVDESATSSDSQRSPHSLGDL
jgi:hypothetical protein